MYNHTYYRHVLSALPLISPPTRDAIRSSCRFRYGKFHIMKILNALAGISGAGIFIEGASFSLAFLIGFHLIGAIQSDIRLPFFWNTSCMAMKFL